MRNDDMSCEPLDHSCGLTILVATLLRNSSRVVELSRFAFVRVLAQVHSRNVFELMTFLVASRSEFCPC